jgi:predicted chitinase
MARRLFNGRQFSEDGWPYVDQDSCTWGTVPGTNLPVRLQIQQGLPYALIMAWAADWNAYIEPLRDADSACWTPGNSVATSNHPGGTACDLNWGSHKYGVSMSGFNAQQQATMKEMEDFYEGNMFWAQRWFPASYVDPMHSQCGYDTYDQDNDRPEQKVYDFCARKIRADGFSTFRRGNDHIEPPPVPQAAQILATATGITLAKAQAILPEVSDGLIAAQCTNVNRIAMYLAQVGEESGSFVYTEEIAKNGRYAPYIGRTWIQITWDYNYRAFSEWCFAKGLVPNDHYFVDNYAELAQLKWAGLGPAWYWTVARPQINAMCDARDLLGVTKAINGGTNGLQDRTNRYNRALALGDQLLTLTQQSTGVEDDMASVPQDQWDRVYRELTQRLPSRSPFRYLNQDQHYADGLVDTVAGFDLNIDGMTHVQYCEVLAGYGHPPTLALLREVAGADPSKYPDRQDDAHLAQAVLARVTAKPTVNAVAVGNMAPQIVYRDIPTPPVPADFPTAGAGSTGQLTGAVIDALAALQQHVSELPPEAIAPLGDLVNILKKGAA